MSFTAWAKKMVLTLGATKDYTEQAQKFSIKMQEKGYEAKTIKATNSTPLTTTIKQIDEALKSLESGDKLIVSLQCHGGVDGDSGHNNWDKPENHYCCLNEDCNNYITSEELIEVLDKLDKKGVVLALMDNSCSGGATVLAFQRKLPNVCTMSSSAASSPSFAGEPDFSDVVRVANTMEDFAIWGSRIIYSKYAKRSHQRVYYTGCAEHTMELRNSFSDASIGSFNDWNLRKSKFLRTLFKLKGKGSWSVEKLEERACAFQNDFYNAWSVFKDELLVNAGDEIFLQLFKQKLQDMLQVYEDYSIENIKSSMKVEEIIAIIINAAEQVIYYSEQASVLLKNLEKFSKMSLEPEQLVETERLKQELKKIQKLMNKLNKEISPILGLYEEVFCETQPSPCREFTL